MSKIARSLGPQISRQVLKLSEKKLLEGAMATSALVAMADRKIRLEESLALGSVLENAELLKLADPRFAVSLHSAFVERMRGDFEVGKRAAMEAVARCADDVEAAQLLVVVGIAIAKADDHFCDAELAMVQEICESLGISGLDPLALAGSTRKLPN